ncbi:SRPBCC family protein [Agromyces sp. NPDC058064]|uniref:SRPBCC family protein n=1 Tax=Agromyces sp. NPDC058064 TaxID=3346322 RepID=UPI0036DA0AB9
MTFTLTLDVDAEPARVFEFIADFATTPQWYSAVQRVERVHGTGGAGTTYTVHRRLPSGPAANTVVVDSCTEGEEITFASVDGPTPFSYRYRVRPAPGGSRLELEGSISAAGLPGPARLLGALAEPLFERGMRSNLKTLKGILEQ